MVFLKIVAGTSAVLGVYLVFPGNYRKFDREILRPIRNYRVGLQDYNRFQTQEEFYSFLGELRSGFGNLFRK